MLSDTLFLKCLSRKANLSSSFGKGIIKPETVKEDSILEMTCADFEALHRKLLHAPMSLSEEELCRYERHLAECPAEHGEKFERGLSRLAGDIFGKN